MSQSLECTKAFKEMYLEVKKAIDIWNPYQLLLHAPDDEFDSESHAITCKIFIYNKQLNVDEIADIISLVFTKSFDDNFSLEDCIIPARQIGSSLGNINSK